MICGITSQQCNSVGPGIAAELQLVVMYDMPHLAGLWHASSPPSLEPWTFAVLPEVNCKHMHHVRAMSATVVGT